MRHYSFVVLGVPVPFSRTRGDSHMNPPAYVAYREKVAETLREQIELSSGPVLAPYSVHVLVGLTSDHSAKMDLDNILKGVVDAIKGPLGVDDVARNISVMSVALYACKSSSKEEFDNWVEVEIKHVSGG